jgi:hypothetical protein
MPIEFWLGRGSIIRHKGHCWALLTLFGVGFPMRSSHLPLEQGVDGSNPVAPTRRIRFYS